MIKNLSVAVILIALAGCDTLPKDWNWGARPRPMKGTAGFPSAKTEYGAGFRDGCGIGWSTVTSGLMGDLVKKNLDPEMITKSADYRAGWWDGFEQCVYIVDWDVL